MRTGLMTRVNDGGLSIILGTANDQNVPNCCRAVGVRASSSEDRTMTVWVPVATSLQIITDLASNPRIALVLSEPVSHETIQVKGTTRVIRLANAEEKEYVRMQMEKFGEVLDQLGLPRRVTSRLNRWPAFAIEFSIEQVFDQTPGPRAGREVK